MSLAGARPPSTARATCSLPVRETSRRPPSAARIVTSLSLTSNPISGLEMSLTTTASSPFRSSLPRPYSIAPAPCSAANPTGTWLPERRCATLLSTSVVGSSSIVGAPWSFLSFAAGRTRRPEVGHRGSHQQRITGPELLLAFARELRGGAHRQHADSRRRRKLHVRRDHRHLRPPARSLGGERKPHPPRRAAADEAHAVDRLARPAGGRAAAGFASAADSFTELLAHGTPTTAAAGAKQALEH
jgi:hypothetical protein